MLFEDLYDSVLRRYRASPAKVEQETQIDRRRLYELPDATRQGPKALPTRVRDENSKGKNSPE